MDEPTVADAAAHDPPPTRLAERYEVQALLGAGGMGSVFLTRDLELDELVALKMLLRHDQKLLQRFRDEVRLARRVTHRNVARTFDIGEHLGEKFLTMEYIPGVSLARHVDRTGPLELAEIIRIGRAMCAGLAAAHEAGVIHRDFKPGNVMIGDDGRVVITDFGLAAPTHTSEEKIVGTLSYMAPEQFAGAPIDEQADIYALGAVLYRMATGERPFEELPNERVTAPNPCDRRGHLSAALGDLVVRCLALDPSKRFASVRLVDEALSAIELDDSPPPTRRVLQRLEGWAARSIAIVIEGESDGLGEGLRAGIIERLSIHPVLRLRPDPVDAEAIVFMQVSATPERVRVDLRCTSAGVDFWGASLAEPWSRAIELTQIVSSRILEALALDVIESPRISPIPPHLVERYLNVRLLLRTRDPADAEKAIATLEDMMRDAPNHPLLLSSLAQARSRLSFFTDGIYESTVQIALDAVRVAPMAAEAHTACGVMLFQGARSSEAAKHLVRALELAPGLADARLTLGVILTEAGAPIQGVRFCQDAVARVPSLTTAWFDIARVWTLLGHPERADAAFANLTGFYPHALSLAARIRYSAWKNDRAKVRALWQELQGLPVVVLANVAKLFVDVLLEDRPPRVLWQAHEATGSPRRRLFSAQLLAEIAAIRGDWDLALEGIQKSVEGGLQDVLWLDRCPVFDELLGNRRFEQMRDVVRGRARSVLEVLDAGA